MNNILDFISSSAQTRYRSRRNTSEGLRRKPSGKGRAISQLQQQEKPNDPDDDPRRPSVEDLALTENLIPPGGKQIYDDEDEDDEAPPAEYSVKKLSELDPRFVSAPGSTGATTASASGAAGGIGSDTESLYGIPYR